jgi:hypothetical protein
MKRWFSALTTWAVFSGAAYPYAVSLVAASVSISLANPSLLPCLRAAMLALQSKGCSFIVEVRGRGLLNAVEVDPSKVPARCILRLQIFVDRFSIGSGVCLGPVRQNGREGAACQAHACAHLPPRQHCS